MPFGPQPTRIEGVSSVRMMTAPMTMARFIEFTPPETSVQKFVSDRLEVEPDYDESSTLDCTSTLRRPGRSGFGKPLNV